LNDGSPRCRAAGNIVIDQNLRRFSSVEEYQCSKWNGAFTEKRGVPGLIRVVNATLVSSEMLTWVA